MHIEHKAGYTMHVYIIGENLQILDELTGELKPVEADLANQGSSQSTYVEAD
jgi:hypothetical protein